MSEEKKDTAATGQADNDKRSFGLQRIYLKDVSFESPRSPDVFRSEWRPAVSINIGMQSRPLGDDTHEVVLTLNVEAKQEDKVAMLIEVQQAGIFTIAGFNDQERHQILGILCPQNLFPFAREEIVNLSVKGGFPQLVLQPVNFERLYQQSLQQQPQAGEA
ncbi:MAG TPA: protein-export chaperone SecB [Gammaproteobacteria bacterium]|nr:protein-export chaperone SecB [Gammaproteobacteria bacterium]